NYGAKFFITQGIFNSAAIIRLLRDYATLCKELDVSPRKIILTFAPCGRAKTLQFIEWLGMHVPQEVRDRILNAKTTDLAEGERDLGPVNESVKILLEVFQEVLEGIKDFNVPIGINVESLSIFREEIDAAHTLFGGLQEMLLKARGRPWAVKWYTVEKGYSAYDDVVVLQKEEKLRKQYLFATAVLSGIFGFVLARSGKNMQRFVSV
ncbi:hypothetical protein TeGR_g9570, partial [Tetraparma gracilis]